jgi:molybdenum cofactor biosynthesis enzyme MoaA
VGEKIQNFRAHYFASFRRHRWSAYRTSALRKHKKSPQYLCVQPRGKYTWTRTLSGTGTTDSRVCSPCLVHLVSAAGRCCVCTQSVSFALPRPMEKKASLKQNEWWKKWVVAWRARRQQQQQHEEEEGLILNEDDTSPSDPISSPVHSTARERRRARARPTSLPNATSRASRDLLCHARLTNNNPFVPNAT